jgi:predicted nicotinamide N-methyase
MSASVASPTQSPQSPWQRFREWFAHRYFRAVGPLRTERVALPGTDRSLQIVRPYPLNRDPDKYLPHWAEIWPAGVVLAGYIAREPEVFAGRRVLEIGPGVGVTAVAAMQAGADLVVADYAPGSLALTALNVREQAGRAPRIVRVNWRYPNSRLREAAGDGFAIVLGADMLYQKEDAKPLAALLEQLLAPDGEVWVAEPGREAAERLVKMLRKRGWSGPTEECASPLPDPQDESWDIMRVHRLRRPAV